jgi:hypothetical protein
MPIATTVRKNASSAHGMRRPRYVAPVGSRGKTARPAPISTSPMRSRKASDSLLEGLAHTDQSDVIGRLRDREYLIGASSPTEPGGLTQSLFSEFRGEFTITRCLGSTLPVVTRMINVVRYG